MTNSYPRESVEFQPIDITADGVPVTTNVTVQITSLADRPTGTWLTPTSLGGKLGIMVQGLTPGTYLVWAKIISAPETPIINCGPFNVT